MNKKIVYISLLSALFIGCSSKEPIATVEATDYALSCNALISEIKEVRAQLSTEKDVNLASNVIGKTLTLGIYSADTEKEIMLRERAKSLQLIYTIKQAKGECRALTKDDINVDNTIINQTKEIKNTVKETKEVITE
jgi:predicted component of type VI protein secretion system